MLRVKGEWLQCYGWDDGDNLLIIDDRTDYNEIPDKQYLVMNLNKDCDRGLVLGYQVEVISH